MPEMHEKDFPILKRKVSGKRLAYLDNAATTQKPRQVIRAVSDFYEEHNANPHRGIHTLSQEATEMYEGARDKVQKFIGAEHREEVVFTSGATEAVNLIATAWGEKNIKRDDEIVLSEMEHHSNLVPWQVLARKKGAKLKFIPVNKEGGMELRKLSKLITRKTKLVAITHVSNFLGTINPIQKIIKAARKAGAKVLIDGAQAGAHLKIDVRKLGTDFYALSGHKMYGPTGIGVLYGKKELLEQMPPYQYGGHMIKKVELDHSTYAKLPNKFEAGTANVAGVIGLGAAVDYIIKIGLTKIQKHETAVTNYALKELRKVKGVKLFGPKSSSGPIISFEAEGIPAHDLASILDKRGVAIRSGHHCTMPAHSKLGLDASARASFALYNNKADVDALTAGIKYAQNQFGV